MFNYYIYEIRLIYIMKNLIIIIIIIILIYALIKFLLKYYHKDLYYIFLKYIGQPLAIYNGKYFIDNFDEIIKPYYIGNTIKRPGKININRNIKHQYTLLDRSVTDGLMEGLMEKNPKHEVLDILLKRLLNYVHLDGLKIDFDDIICVDVLTASGSYYPWFHTDIEWDTFRDSNGFQVWILLEEDKKILPRGNMFLLETEDIKHANILEITKDEVFIKQNDSKIFHKTLKKFNSLKEINPKISYLNGKVGEVFIMNPLLYHCSDPYNVNSKRRAINFRVLHKPTKSLNVFNPDNNYYSKVIMDKHNVKMVNKEYGILNFDNKKNRYKMI